MIKREKYGSCPWSANAIYLLLPPFSRGFRPYPDNATKLFWPISNRINGVSSILKYYFKRCVSSTHHFSVRLCWSVLSLIGFSSANLIYSFCVSPNLDAMFIKIWLSPQIWVWVSTTLKDKVARYIRSLQGHVLLLLFDAHFENPRFDTRCDTFPLI